MSGTTVEHSTDGGRTWTELKVNPHSIIAGLSPGQQYDDGFGNLYRGVQR